MKFRIISDLHIDEDWTIPFTLPELETDSETILILAGDVCERLKAYKEVSEWIKRFHKVVYVMGNHEYYRGSMIRTPIKIMLAHPHPNKFFVLNQNELVLDDHVIIGAPLWTDFDTEHPLLMLKAEHMMNDYRLIRVGGENAPYARKLKPIDIVFEHKNNLAYIKERVEHWSTSDKKIIVVSHHAPSYRSVSPQFEGHELNGCYANNLDEYIESTNIKLWIHGHMHNRVDYMIGNCRVVCNPRGYQSDKYQENTGFDPLYEIDL